MFTIEGISKLYTKLCVIKVLSYKLICSNALCTKYWNGADFSVYRISKNVSCGYEIGWDFVDCIHKVGVNFSGYCSMMTSSYKRHDEQGEPFMTSPTFMKWFKAWTSNQKIDFRSQCAVCGENPRMLACDAVKLGPIGQNCSFDPIEKPKRRHTANTPQAKRTGIPSCTKKLWKRRKTRNPRSKKASFLPFLAGVEQELRRMDE